MISANRRDAQLASEVVLNYPPNLPVEEVQTIAEQMIARMRQAGFAHQRTRL